MFFPLLLATALIAGHLCDANVTPIQRKSTVRAPTTAAPKPKTKNWALIAVGSNGYDNYRHQADACHAYQILRQHGIPEENIVTMMYDDIAHSKQNPTPGVIINHPEGKDVYAGVKIDYKGKDVTVKNFLAVLRGDKSSMKGKGNGKVIASGPNDRVFVNLIDHGSVGQVSFPDNYMKASDLVNTLKSMYREKKYKELVLYVEACYSGTLFDKILPKNISIYAVTAANTNESSYSAYWDEKRGAFLGDEFSVNWMEDSDAKDLRNETLADQYVAVRNKTEYSHVSVYGDKAIDKQVVANFQGDADKMFNAPEPKIVPAVKRDGVPANEVPLVTRQRRLAATKDEALKQKLQKEINDIIKERSQVMKTIKDIVAVATEGIHDSKSIFDLIHPLTDFECYEPIVDLFHKRCFDIVKTDSVGMQLKLFVNMCEERIPLVRIIEAINKVCRV